MRVAVTLTGLIEDRHLVAPYIKEIFDYISRNHDITFDFYFHYWSSDRPYLYKIKNDILGPVSFPKESIENIKFFIDTINPVAVITNNYSDLKDLYVSYGISSYNADSPFINVTEDIVEFLDLVDLYYDKEMSEDIFLTINDIRAGINFDSWWELHKHWYMFNHNTAQFFAVEQCLKAVKNSEINYDAVLKWRSDQLFNYYERDNLLVKELLDAVENNTFTTSHAWRSWLINGIETRRDLTNEDIRYNLNTFQENTFSINDTWWIISKKTSDLMADSFIETYCYVKQQEKKLGILSGNHHSWLFRTLLELKLRPKVINHDIYCILIRNPNLLSTVDYRLNHSKFSILANDNQRKSKINKFLANGKIEDTSYRYAVAKHFNFLGPKLPYE